MTVTEKIHRGYAANGADEKRLREAGVKVIYRGDKGEPIGRFRMRSGELLGVVNGLRAFGDARREMVSAVTEIHLQGAVIIDAEIGLRSDKNGVEMLNLALAPRRPSDDYRKAQAAGVANRTKGRMGKREALIIWRNPKLSVRECIELMHKWSQATAYKQLGRRDVPAGRRPK